MRVMPFKKRFAYLVVTVSVCLLWVQPAAADSETPPYEPGAFGGVERVIVTDLAPIHYGDPSGSLFFKQESAPHPETGYTVTQLMQASMIDGSVRAISPLWYSNYNIDVEDFYVSNTGRYVAYRFWGENAWVADLTDGSFRQVTFNNDLDNTISNTPPVLNWAPDDSRLYIREDYTDNQLWGVDMADPTLTPVRYADGANNTPRAYLASGEFIHTYLASPTSGPYHLALSDPVTREMTLVMQYTTGNVWDVQLAPDDSFAIARSDYGVHHVPLNQPGAEPTLLTEPLSTGVGLNPNPNVYGSWLRPDAQAVYFMASVDRGASEHVYRSDLATNQVTRLTDAIPAGGDMSDGALVFYDAPAAQDARYYFTSSYNDLDLLFEGKTYSDEAPVQIATLFQYSNSFRPHDTILEVSPDGKLLLAIKRDYRQAIAVDLETGETHTHTNLSSSNFVIDMERKLIFQSDFLLGPEGYHSAVVVQPLDGSSDPIPLLYNDVRTQGFKLSADLDSGELMVLDASSYAPGHHTYVIDINGTFLLGDLNGDWQVTHDDIAPFVLALIDPAGFESAYPFVDPDLIGDLSGDGRLTNADIAGFVDLLAAAGPLGAEDITQAIAQQGATVPEPASVCLIGLGLLAVRRRRRVEPIAMPCRVGRPTG